MPNHGRWNLMYRFEYFQQHAPLAPYDATNPGPHRAPRARWYVRLRRVENGEILMVSEAYTRRWSAKRAAQRMARAFNAVVEAAADV